MRTSCHHTRKASRVSMSPMARARITVAMVCDPALPPVPIISGTKAARATTAWISSSNARITSIEKVPARKRAASQPIRLRVTTKMLVSR